MSAQNLGTKFKFADDEDEQTLTFAGGLSYTTDWAKQIPNVDLTVGRRRSDAEGPGHASGVGGEVWVWTCWLCGSVTRRARRWATSRIGAGFRYSDFQLDYTYADYEDLEATHSISLTMAFGD